MSTQINITVDSGGLSDRAKQQQQAARQAQLEKERTLNLSAEALDKRVAAQAAKGLSLDGQPLYAAAFQQPKVERRPAANRFTAPQLLYYHSTPPTFNAYGDPSGFIAINKKSSNYQFTSAPEPLTITTRYAYSSSGGPYDQSFVSATNNNTRVLFRDVSTFPTLAIEPKNVFSGYTIEIDFRPGQASGYPNANRIRATVRKIQAVPVNVFGFDFVQVTISPQFTGTEQNIRVDWPYNPSAAVASFKVGQTMPLNVNQWNRIAITVANTEVRIYVNGVFYDSVVNETGYYNPDNALWPYDASAYIAAGFYADTQDIGTIGFDLDGYVALSAAKITPKILYTQNYTPSKIS